MATVWSLVEKFESGRYRIAFGPRHTQSQRERERERDLTLNLGRVLCISSIQAFSSIYRRRTKISTKKKKKKKPVRRQSLEYVGRECL